MQYSKIPFLQFLRFLFVLIIVVYNFPIDSILYKNIVIKNINLFISFFFVFSSYLLYMKLENIEINNIFFRNFLKNLFLKIYPIHFIFLFFFGLIEIIKIFYIDAYSYSALYDTYDFKDFLINLFFLNGFQISPHTFNQPSWSVSLLIWTIILYVFLSLISKKLVIVFSLCLSTCLLAIIINNYNYEFMYKYRNLLLTFSFSSTYLICFLLKSENGFFKIFPKLKKIIFLSYFFMVLSLIVLILLIYYFTDLAMPFVYLLVIIYFFRKNYFVQHKENRFYNNLFIYLGNVSFIWYMSHFLFSFTVRQVLKIYYNYPINLDDLTISFGAGSEYITLIVLLSSLFFSVFLFEIQKKIMHSLNKNYLLY